MKRLYEWRDAKGNLHRKPVLAENACAFRVSQTRGGVVQQIKGPSNPVWVYVTATGEKVLTEINAGCSAARLENEPLLPWYNADGQAVKP